MHNFIFENTTKVYFGTGCVKEYLTCLVKGYGDNVMLAYGRGSAKKNGIYDEVTDILKAAGKNIIEFSGIMANPTYAKVLEGARLAREQNAGLILGIGRFHQGNWIASYVEGAGCRYSYGPKGDCSFLYHCSRKL